MVAMFAPSFGTGPLIQRVGPLPVMFIGTLLAAGCIAVALTGVDVMHFWLALVLVGVAWNFMYLGATTLITETHTPAERGKVQGVNDMAISFTMVLSSLSVGALFTYQGWQFMNMLAAPLMVVCAAGIVWLALARRARATAA
jgi:MFS family permease